MTATAKPTSEEYAPAYAGYVGQVSAENVIAALENNGAETLALVRGLSAEKGDYRYAEGKWSVKELIGHITDSERIFAYRILRIARGDATPLPGFDQDPYVVNGLHATRTLASLADEFETVRGATLSLVKSLDETAWARRGVASDNEISVRALIYITAGHEIHHVKILQERYL
jgi:uncharacterized damage-inducible protein DinB